MALERHTRQLIKPRLQTKHMELCHEYRKCRSKTYANLAVASIKAWWFSSGVCLESVVKELISWPHFWHFCYEQWRSHMSEVWSLIFGL